MKKRITSLALALVMCLSLCITASAQPNNTIMSTEDMAQITATYANELSRISQENNISLNAINRQTLPIIVNFASSMHNDQSRYSDLVSDIALACSKYTRLNMLPRATRIENYTSRTVVNASYLYGEELKRVAVGQSGTITNTYTIRIDSGSIIKNVSVDASFSTSVGYSLTGPLTGTLLGNGIRATHNVAVGFVYGTIIHEEFDIVDLEQGGRTHISHNIIDPNTSSTSYYTLTAAFGSSKVYVQHALNNSLVLSYRSESEFHRMLKEVPTQFF